MSPDALYREVRFEIRRGNLNHALQEAERGYREWRQRPESKPYWQFRTAKAEVLLAQGKAQEALPWLEGRMPAGPAFRELAVRQLLDQGYAKSTLGDFGEARGSLQQAASLAPGTGNPLLLGEIDLRQGSLLGLMGDSRGAELHYRRALEAALAQGDLYLQANATGGLGFNLLRNSRFDEALTWLEQALLLAEKAGARVSADNTLGNLGRCYYELGDFDRAAQLLSRAADLAGEIGDAHRRSVWLGLLGDAAVDGRGDAYQATLYYREALAGARRLGERNWTARWLERLTEVALSAGDQAAAANYNREALELSRQTGDRSLNLWALFHRAEIEAANGAFAAAERGFQETATSVSDPQDQNAVWEAHAALGNLYARAGRWTKADADYQAALAAFEQSRETLARDESKLSFHASSKRLYRDYVGFLMDRGRSERALEVVESSRARMLAQKLGVLEAALHPAGASRFREMARALAATLVSVWLAPRRSFAWVVTPQRIDVLTLPGEEEFNAAVQAYSSAIRGLRDPLESANPAGRRLSEMLLAPLAKWVPAGSKVVLAPDGALHELNLEALPTLSGPPHYWLEDVTLAIVPSLALLDPARPGRRSGGDSLLLIGNPVPAAAEYPPLPDAAGEVENLRRRFPGPQSLVLTGAAASPAAYREANPGRFSLIHFSAHATANRESPLDSAVILSRQGEAYKLYAREVVGLPLRARLVTISACRGAGARIYSGEGLVGFAWAFLQAGAGNVIAGLWDVNDRSTAALMDRLYAGLNAGRAPAAALRDAKLELLRSAGPYRKPYYWAPFQLFTRSPAF